MIDNYIFSGTGFVTGSYEVSNGDIEKYIKSGYLEGFDEERIASSPEFLEFLKSHPGETAFNYMTEHIMGFRKRFHVVPFPPVAHNYKEAANSLDLCVEAIQKALNACGLSGDNIDAWFVGTATPHQYAPGIGEFAKSYFTDIYNQAPVFSLTSACVGFNINLSRALSWFESHPEAKHIIIAHAEVMSALLPEQKDFVPFSTFGDSAAAVVLSRIQSDKPQGIIAITNNEDSAMLDFLGADDKGNLYMNPRMVKMRAVPNISNTVEKLLKKCNWNKEELLYFIPHQTGNAIVDSVAQRLGIDSKIVFKEIQTNFGNLSGASVPACFTILEQTNRLSEGGKIIASVAGLGGEYGGFAYIVPDKKYKFDTQPELKGKTILITGATGGLGREIATLAAAKGAELLLHYNSNQELAEKIKSDLEQNFASKVHLYKADLSDKSQADKFCNLVKAQFKSIDFLLNTHAITGSLGKASIVTDSEFEKVLNSNYLSVKNICIQLKDIVTGCILITGSVGEDAQFSGSSSYVASKRALRGFAVNLATEVYKNKTRCIYYLPGIVDSGMMGKLDKSQISMSMNAVRQKQLIPVKDIAERMLKSVYRLKIPNVRISYESNLKVIKDSYLNF